MLLNRSSNSIKGGWRVHRVHNKPKGNRTFEKKWILLLLLESASMSDSKMLLVFIFIEEGEMSGKAILS